MLIVTRNDRIANLSLSLVPLPLSRLWRHQCIRPRVCDQQPVVFRRVFGDLQPRLYRFWRRHHPAKSLIKISFGWAVHSP